MKLRWICAVCSQPAGRCDCDRHTRDVSMPRSVSRQVNRREAPRTGQRSNGGRNRIQRENEAARGSALLDWMNAEPRASQIAQRLAVALDCEIIDAAEILAWFALKVRG